MTANYQDWTKNLERLDRALLALEPAAAELNVPRAHGQEWYELLKHKLLPQAMAEPLLVVAVVGGTNIGKSAVFNQLAGENASAVSPLAAGTKHPVCLTPGDTVSEQTLRTLFEGFELRPWHSAQEALVSSDAHLLFWRSSPNVPKRLLLLDTPDVDSDAEVNWQRADTIRQSADVLIAILTQQKYNDAAVKQFFRKAAESDKAVIVVFNQCDLTLDAPYWPEWLRVFMESTGVQPEFIYVVPYDRKGAGEMRLPFHPVGRDGREPPGPPADLRAELAALHFDAIKIRTFRGALAKVTDPVLGAGGYLSQLREASRQFEAASAALSTSELARIGNWPPVPASLLVDEITAWWDERRPPWSRTVHGLYRKVGRGLTWPVRAAWRGVNGESIDSIAQFRAQERAAIVETIQKVFAQLERLAELGNDILRPRLQAVLGGNARARLLERVQHEYDKLPALDESYREFLRGELDEWRSDNPRVVWWLQSMDHVAAVARPAITVTLAITGGVFAGEVVQQAAVHTATQLATEAAIAGGVTASGEAAVSATSESIKQAGAQLFRRLQYRYAEQRIGWLGAWLERALLVNLLTELRRGASVPTSAPFKEAEAALTALGVRPR